MLSEERRRAIVEMLQEEGRVLVKDLAKREERTVAASDVAAALRQSLASG